MENELSMEKKMAGDIKQQNLLLVCSINLFHRLSELIFF
jgi:hypothetical protein